MNILVIGSGGREHALCWAIRNSSLCDELYCAPGNGGITGVAKCVPLDAANHDAVAGFCTENDIGLVVVGPEVPLVAGLADDLRAKGFTVFGPSQAAAQLEGSKGFTKDLCKKHEIPTAAYGRFGNLEDAKSYLVKTGAPVVVKADGLAAGKGVIIAETVEQAEQALDDIFAGAFGEAGAEVVIEEFLVGEEASFFALVDGKTALPLTTAQDHKRAFDGDEGPNTGGMGAYSPAPVMSDELCQRTMDEIILPTVSAMAEGGAPYQGVLYAGLMITENGPQLIEYNVRFGDPECQVLMMRLKDDILSLMMACCESRLDKVSTIRWHDDAALTVVMAAKGYPGSYDKGSIIGGLAQARSDTEVEIFHAGTKMADNGAIISSGGRVLNVTALGKDVTDAQKRAYDAVSQVEWPGGFYRHDIGWRAVKREVE